MTKTTSYYLQSKINKNLRKPEKIRGFFLSRKERYLKNRKCDECTEGTQQIGKNQNNCGSGVYTIEGDPCHPNNPDSKRGCPDNCCPSSGNNNGLLSYLPEEAFSEGCSGK